MNNMNELHRRDFLKMGAAATAAALLPANLSAAKKWKNIPIGTQAWCVRKQMAGDIPGTLKAVAALGYQGIELENLLYSVLSRRLCARNPKPKTQNSRSCAELWNQQTIARIC